MKYSPIVTPKVIEGFVSRQTNLGVDSYDLDELYSPDTDMWRAKVLDLGSPKYAPQVAAAPTRYWFDRSRNNSNGTITGATWKRLPSGVWVMGFDGDDYITLPVVITSAMWQGTADFTYIVWAKTTAFTTASQSLIALGQATDSYTYGQIHLRTITVSSQAKNRLSIGVRDNTNQTDWRWTTDNNTNLVDNTFYMFCVTQTSGTIAMFINGISVGITQDLAGTRTGASFANTKTLLGARSTDVAEAYSLYLTGVEGGNLVYNQALSASKIQQIYLATRWRYQ